MDDPLLFRHSRPLYFVLDSKGNPVQAKTLREWAEFFETSKRKLADVYIGEDVWVSTVFLGIDHGFSLEPDEPPILWETMVFHRHPPDPQKAERFQWDRYRDWYWDGDEQWRYSSRESAKRGHDKVVAAIRAGADLNSDEFDPTE